MDKAEMEKAKKFFAKRNASLLPATLAFGGLSIGVYCMIQKGRDEKANEINEDNPGCAFSFPNKAVDENAIEASRSMLDKWFGDSYDNSNKE